MPRPFFFSEIQNEHNHTLPPLHYQTYTRASATACVLSPPTEWEKEKYNNERTNEQKKKSYYYCFYSAYDDDVDEEPIQPASAIRIYGRSVINSLADFLLKEQTVSTSYYSTQRTKATDGQLLLAFKKPFSLLAF